MIREFQRDDINKVADIWLDTNIKAHIKINTKGDVRMKAHEYWSVGALITMLGTFYSGYKGLKSSHKYFAASSLLCMIMAIYTGHKMISKNKKTKKEPISLGNEE